MVDKKMKLRVWHNPQLGSGCPTFHVEVWTIREAVGILKALADYDNYQFENKIKPDFSNAQGLQSWNTDNNWEDWEIDDEALGYYDEPEEYLEQWLLLEEY